MERRFGRTPHFCDKGCTHPVRVIKVEGAECLVRAPSPESGVEDGWGILWTNICRDEIRGEDGVSMWDDDDPTRERMRHGERSRMIRSSANSTWVSRSTNHLKSRRKIDRCFLQKQSTHSIASWRHRGCHALSCACALRCWDPCYLAARKKTSQSVYEKNAHRGCAFFWKRQARRLCLDDWSS